MISAILIYGLRGEVLASRIYKDGLRRAVTDAFRVQVISNPDNKAPLLTLGSTSFLHIRHGNLYVVAVTRHDVDAALVYELLYKIVDLCTNYLGTFDETTCQKNVTTMYELLDEIVDYGYPQNTDRDSLKPFLTTGNSSNMFSRSILSTPSSAKSSAGSAVNKMTQQVTSNLSWRRDGIKYRRNEVFVDIFEDVNVIMDPHGDIISSDVNGRVQVKSHLSGMPECRIGLNDRPKSSRIDDDDAKYDAKDTGRVAKLQEFQFHQCVDLKGFNDTGTVVFIPPDGEFELVKYKVKEDIRVPFRLSVNIGPLNGGRIEYQVRLKSTYDSKLNSADLIVYIPIPPRATKTSQHASNGKVKYNGAEHRFEWKIGRLSGGSDITMTGHVDTTPSAAAWVPPAITAKFSVSMFSSSGLAVRYLKVHDKSNYSTLKWVRYLAKAGSYEARVA